MSLLLGAMLAGVAWGEPGTEFVIVLDNSCSMVEVHSTPTNPAHAAADPDRRAVLGAQIVEALTAGTQDRTSVLAFPVRENTGVLEIGGAADLRNIPPSSGTYFRGPLARARQILEGSTKDDRMLMVLSDGAPNDYERPAEGRALLGLDEGSSAYETLVLGLFEDEDSKGEAMMRALARHPADYHRVTAGGEVVQQFTRGYARALGSKAVTGELSPGRSTTFEAGKYVTEVLAVTTTVDRSGDYTASLEGPKGRIAPRAVGDNGCTHRPSRNPTFCDPPRMHFKVWRTAMDPTRPAPWTLSIPKASGDVAYGVILRYDLRAAVDETLNTKIGEPGKVRARLLWKDAPFDDAGFFDKDGFAATAEVDGQKVALSHVGDGVFEGEYTPTSSAEKPITVRFSNTWMEKTARGRFRVVAPDPLTVSAPANLDFGTWQAGRWATRRCTTLAVTSNHPFDPATATFDFADLPDGTRMEVTPSSTGWEVCVRAKGCCGDVTTSAASALLLRAVDADQSAADVRIPVTYTVHRTGFLWCWWPWILGLLVLLFLLWVIIGWIRPHDFDEDLTIKIAGSERQLSRSAGLVLREQPKGRRGFYRNARVSLTAAGDFVAKTRNAAVWIEAVGSGATRFHPQGPLEVKDRRTKQWIPIPPEEAADGLRTNVVYRLGDTYFRFQ